MATDFEDRIESEAQAVVGRSNKDMACMDCKHRAPKPAICAVYPDIKPISIMFEHGGCKFYEKEKK